MTLPRSSCDTTLFSSSCDTSLLSSSRQTGSHVRRRILLTVHKRQQECQQQLDTARENLFKCSQIENPNEWQTLFTIVTTTAMTLGEISSELRRLEHIHVNTLGGHLPY
ncbi:unnamed protein product [Rotaria sordida]|uniref:Uncharacterized protein n=1 Tax=Rotaria sordida TaxID=392033 RepID=A0A815RED3_9BILA|nr:unnamed protein product [Rotaria sordida]